MKLKGYFTIEASYVFTILTLIVIGLIRLNFYMHDNLINDVCKVLGGLRYYQTVNFYYDSESETIDTKAIANSPIFGEDSNFASNSKAKINENVSEYFQEKRIGFDVELTDTNIDEVITDSDNANLVRSGGKLIQVIGGNGDEN